MSTSDAQIRATNKWNKKAYYRPSVCLRREYEEPLRKKAAAKGESVSAYIQDLIKKDLGIKED